MRVNLPIYDVETKLREDQYLISRTDTKGRIVYANPAFVEVSGFERDELIGKAHNLVRHPDMPPQAYEDLWRTLQAGQSWLGVVKNRRKDGGFYWVLANATPIYEDGEVVAYSSVRVKASDEQIEAAEAAYAQLRAGTLRGRRLWRGQVVPTGWRRVLAAAAFPLRGGLSARMLRQSLLAALGVLAMQWRLRGAVLRTMEGAADMARQVAAGNLTTQIGSDANDEVGKLAFSLDVMRKNLVGIARGNQELSARTDDQSASLQNTAASMEELTS
ncbi:methyl-accepting chemotaxis protein, partial [Bordetella pertussis]